MSDMALVTMREVSWGFDAPPLLDKINFQIEKGERVCLLGRNGVGKSTFLRLLNGEISADHGEIWRQQGIKTVMLPQEVCPNFNGTLFDLIAQGFGDQGKIIIEYNRLHKKNETKHAAGSVKSLEQQHQLLEIDGGWTLFSRIESVLSRTGLDPETRYEKLSAGKKRQALFARAIAQTPDILLLDEPTNHLDMESVIWMEEFIVRHIKTLVFITHDRFFLKNVATRILELDRGDLVSHSCGYETYLKRKQAVLSAEEKQNAEFDKKLSREEAWIRQGVKARRTRNEGRVRALEKLRQEYRARRKKIGNVNFRVHEAEKTGKLVIEAEEIGFSHENHPVVANFSTTIMRGDKVGIIGPNGIGKTTLLNILLKKIPPDEGRIRHGTNIQTAYFDQLHAVLDEHKTVAENIGEGNDFIVFNGIKRHVISYLNDFLFSPQRSRMPVHVLSGGEKNRLLLAKLFTKPFNLLVLDEPTNDLDMETLELLEELLFEFSGTVLLVSHDRAFLNGVVTSTIVFEENGRITQYAGGYDDWLLQRRNNEKTPLPKENSFGPKRKPRQESRRSKVLKLTFKEQQELKDLPEKIDSLENMHKELFNTLADPSFYKNDAGDISRVKLQLEETEKSIETAYARWEELESRNLS